MTTFLKPLTWTILVGIAIPAASLARTERDQAIEMNSVPKAVQDTFHEKAGKAKILRVEKETEHGQTSYEAIVSKHGSESAIEVAPDGRFLNTHDETREHGARK